MLWYGAIVNIPPGWALCDGNNGTPDLRDRFIVGAGNSYAVGATGGAINHMHTGTTNGHCHWLTDGTYLSDDTPSGSEEVQTDVQTDTFTSDASDGRPPYYALAFIMKL